MRSEASLVPAFALLLVASLLAVAGCAPSGLSGETQDDRRGTPASTSAPADPAGDGTNYAACAEGSCEVAVSGPVDIPLTGVTGLATLSITLVDVIPGGSMIAYDITYADGTTGHGYVVQGDTYGVIGGIAYGASGPTELELVRVVGRSVVLHIFPA